MRHLKYKKRYGEPINKLEKITPQQVLIEPAAFLSMILSTIEVYHQEAFGLLLGNKGERFTIEHAVPLQAVERTMYRAAPNPDREKRIVDLSERLGLGIQLLGDFHSHAQIGSSKGKAIPSVDDLATMEPGYIYIIIAINQKERDLPWSQNKDKTISGTLGNYHFKIAAYLAWSQWKYYKLQVLCPIATGI